MPTYDLTKPRQVDFATVEKDFEIILERFLSNQNLLKLLYYTDADCLSKEDITSADDLIAISDQNIRITPYFDIPENKGSFIILTFDDFSPNATNPAYMDNFIVIDILCPKGTWSMNDYMQRPFRIMHEVQKLLDKQKLNGIGVVNFLGAKLLNLGEIAGYQAIYSVINDV